MVRLTKIYTKVGDRGQTMLGDGTMVPKSSARVQAYGDVDEANASIGAAICALPAHGADPDADEVRALLTRIQNEMFDLGADLCVPIDEAERSGKSGPRLRIVPGQIKSLEEAIDRFNASLAPLNSFVLPGGTVAAAALHAARTVVRRAERGVAGLMEVEGDRTNPDALIYLNRLSDLLFVLSRVMNRSGGGDVLWKPGATRSE